MVSLIHINEKSLLANLADNLYCLHIILGFQYMYMEMMLKAMMEYDIFNIKYTKKHVRVN